MKHPLTHTPTIDQKYVDEAREVDGPEPPCAVAEFNWVAFFALVINGAILAALAFMFCLVCNVFA